MVAGVRSGLLATLAVLMPVGSPGAAESIPVPGQRSLSDIKQIELTYTEASTAPTVTVVRRQSVEAPVPTSYRPVRRNLDLLAILHGGRAFGTCATHVTGATGPIHVRFAGRGGQRCGLAWSLLQTGKPLDALSYHRLRLRGVATGKIIVALTDATLDRHEDNVPVAQVAGAFSIDISLASVARKIDWRQLTGVILLADGDTEMTLEEASLQSTASTAAAVSAPDVGFWVWDYHKALKDPESVMASCLRHGCRRLFLQMPRLDDSDVLWTAYVGLFLIARKAQIELFALDGYPEAIEDPAALADKVTKLVSRMGLSRLPGVQLDIEPYLLPDFEADRTTFNRYLAAIDHVKEALNGQGRLSVVMPFWFTSLMFEDRPIAWAVMDRVDEVAVMSYRTDAREVVRITDDLLRYGQLAGVPVWLALETIPLPVERHIVLKPETRADLADGYLNAGRRTLVLGPLTERGPEEPIQWFRIHHRYTVRPETITFAGRSRRAVHETVQEVFTLVDPPGLAGIIIHDLDGYRALKD